ncbi:MAG: serine hydrolase [candidate division Zixibacteria bacterium]|nr:serine hydrolase [candidate division Zixibacteria bacterium]
MGVKHVALLRLYVIAFVCGLAGQVYSQSLEARIDDLIDECVLNDQFMGSVLVAENGEVILAKGYGLADVNKNIPNTPETLFPIGSISKQFTAMLVTQLVEKGKLRLDNTIADFLPDFPEDIGQKITVEMLLCHTAGLPFPEGIEEYYYVSTKNEYLQEFLKQLAQEGLRFNPGEGYGYSNAGYFILGLIIEKVTGKTYEEVLDEQILKPLDMSNTLCARKGLTTENMAVSYQKPGGQYITWNEDTNAYDPAVCGFAYGSIISTVRDLFKFSQALSSDKLLSRPYMDMYLQMRNVKSRPPVPNISEGLAKEFFGICGNGFVGEISILEDPATGEKETLYWHDGTSRLFKSNHFYYGGKDQVIIIFSNCSFLCEGNEMVLRIHQLLNNKPYEHVRIKHSLMQYVEDDIAMHAGIPVAIDEYLRLKDDTANFTVPGPRYLAWIGREVAERGYPDDAILILQTTVSEFPDTWEVYDALAEIHLLRGDTAAAIQHYRRSLDINAQNDKAATMIKQLCKE